MMSALAFLKTSFRYKRTLLLLTAADLRQRYIGSAGGAIWFVAGLVPWLLFSESVTNSISAISRNAHLVKSIVFPTETLPLVQLAAASAVHVILLVPILVAAAFLGGLAPQLVQLPYYLVATLAFALGLAWLLAALNPFLRDVAPAMTVILNLWFWLTPIAWPETILAPEIQRWMWLNPLYYLVRGYRDSIFGGAWLWQEPWALISFWIICLAMLAIGAIAFRRLKPAFAEVV